MGQAVCSVRGPRYANQNKHHTPCLAPRPQTPTCPTCTHSVVHLSVQFHCRPSVQQPRQCTRTQPHSRRYHTAAARQCAGRRQRQHLEDGSQQACIVLAAAAAVRLAAAGGGGHACRAGSQQLGRGAHGACHWYVGWVALDGASDSEVRDNQVVRRLAWCVEKMVYAVWGVLLCFQVRCWAAALSAWPPFGLTPHIHSKAAHSMTHRLVAQGHCFIVQLASGQQPAAQAAAGGAGAVADVTAPGAAPAGRGQCLRLSPAGVRVDCSKKQS